MLWNASMEQHLNDTNTAPSEEPLRVLVVDDDQANLLLINKILSIQGFAVVSVKNGEEALRRIKDGTFDIVLLDVMMPGKDGFEICKIIKSDDATRLIPVIILTALNSREDKLKGIEAGCEDFISKPLDKTELVTRIKALGKVKRLNDDLDRAEAVVMSLARAVEAKDDGTGGHCDRLIDLSRQFGIFLGLAKADLKTIERAAVLHDLGKIGMPDSLLLKPGKLTEEEWKIMRKHPEIGESICRPLRTLKNVCPIILTHHERWNGSGYPNQIKGKDIPYLARVFQILDAYDSLTTERPYKKAHSKDETIKMLLEETEKGMWDPELMMRFVEFVRER